MARPNLGKGLGFEHLTEMPDVGSTVLFHAPCGILAKVLMSEPYIINPSPDWAVSDISGRSLVWVMDLYYLEDKTKHIFQGYVSDIYYQMKKGVVLPPRPEQL